ncbi:MAG: hypothetical protein R2865_14745 [Deinococcales bacterium]
MSGIAKSLTARLFWVLVTIGSCHQPQLFASVMGDPTRLPTKTSDVSSEC